jgi:hypothetical protein|tara:strand:- start:74 stop:253 length:180 start_codon:yes stop_codon:yes gene_type:complete
MTTKGQLFKDLEGLPDDTIIQVYTQDTCRIYEDLLIDVITDGPNDEIIQAVHININAYK